MSTGALNSALKGLTAARAGMELVADNLANANTKGFARRRLLLEPAQAVRISGMGDIGGGVNIAGVERVTDAFLEQRVNSLAGESVRADVLVSSLSELESLLPELEGAGLTGALTAMESAALGLTAAPSEPGARMAFIGSAETFADRLHQVSAALGRLRGDLSQEISGVVDEVNQLSAQVAAFNLEILRSAADGGSGNNLRDRRASALRQLQELVGGDVRYSGRGNASLFVGGRELVSSQTAASISIRTAASGQEVVFGDSAGAVPIASGRLSGLLQMYNVETVSLQAGLDGVARSTMLAYDAAHARGVGSAGPFRELLAAQAFTQEGDPLQVLSMGLNEVDSRFPIQDGVLTIAVEDVASGDVTTSRVAIDDLMTVGALISQISAVDGVEANLIDNRLGLVAEPGKRFSFAPVTTTRPDPQGAFGGAQATAVGTRAEPFSLVVPATLSVSIDGGGAQALPLVAGDFLDPLNITAGEMVAAINKSLVGGQALVVGGKVAIQSATTGPSSGVSVAANTTSTALGLSGASDAGAAVAVDPRVEGQYTGSDNERWEVVVVGGGTVGVTDGLRLEVRSSSVLATIDIGLGYTPGSQTRAVEGLSFRMGSGVLEAGDSFFVDVTADSDTAGLLVSLGLNTLFTGDGAADIQVRSDLRDNSDLLATSRTHDFGDSGGAVALADAGDSTGSTGLTARQTAEAVFEGLGRNLSEVRRSSETNSALLRAVEARQAALSGVSLDEEAANLIQLKRAFEASARVVQAVRDLDAVLFSILR